MSCDVGQATERFENELWLFIASPTSQLILQSFRRFTYITAHSTTLPLLHLRHSHLTYVRLCLILQLFIASPRSQLILQPFRCFTYVIGTSPTSQLILQPFCRFIYIAAHSTILPLLHLRHRHFSYVRLYLILQLFIPSPTSQLIIQPFRRFTYITARANLLLLHLRHRHFTYFTWRAAHQEYHFFVRKFNGHMVTNHAHISLLEHLPSPGLFFC